MKLNLRQKLSLRILSQYIDLQAKVHELSYLFWECTLRCNIQCLHCGSDCRTDNSVKDMPSRDFLRVTSEIRNHYNPNKVMVVLTGGEPLMRQDLEEIGVELYKQGYPWGMVTNGLALTEERFRRLLQSGLRSITVSLDGEKEEHSWLRGNNYSYEGAIRAIKMSVREQNIAFDVVTCVNKRNIEKLDKIQHILLSLGVKNWRLFMVSPIGRAKNDDELKLSPEQFVTLMKFIESCRKEGKIMASFGCEGYLGGYEGKVRSGYFFCRAGINIGSVLNDGSISACPNNSRHVVQGNIYTDNFIDVWKNKFQIMRKRSWAKQGLCKECKSFAWCRGNGLHLRDFENNDVLMCHLKLLEKGSQ